MLKEFREQFSDLELSKRFPGVRLPALKIDDEDYNKIGVSNKVSNFDFLKALCVYGFKEKVKNGKIPEDKKAEYIERIKFELGVFQKLQFTDYILIVWDVINFCNKRDISVGLGRGSAAGSATFWLIGVTGLDPIKYGLYFQRFVSEARAKSTIIDGVTYLDGSLMCDVDLDIDYLRRHEVVEYLEKKYPDRTSKILNLVCLTGKNLIKEVGKTVAEKSEHEMNQVSNMIDKVFGNVDDISDTYKKNPEFKKWCDENKDVYPIALGLRDLIKNKGVHASGLVLSYDPLTGRCPVELSGDKELVSGFSMKDILAFCVKLDLLGLKTMSMIRSICDLAGIKVSDIPYEEDICYEQLKNPLFPLYGIFQLDAPTASKIVRKVKPGTLKEVSDVTSLARPGAMAWVDDYIHNRDNPEKIKTIPLFEEVLKPSNNICIYQEQMMALLNKIGFSLADAEIARRVIGKKLKKEVAEWEGKVYNKLKENGLPKEYGDYLWKVLNDSADYSFNKSHSISYSAISGMTAYLKTKYPLEYFLINLRMSRIFAGPKESAEEKVERIAKECLYFGIKLLPPDLLIGNEDYVIEGKSIRFGLSSIKGVAENKIVKLREFSIDKPNKLELFESAKTAKIDIGTLASLIQVGALQGFSESRTRLVLEAQLWNLLTPKEKQFCLANGEKYGWDVINLVQDINNWTQKVEQPERLVDNLTFELQQQGASDKIIEKEAKKLQKKIQKEQEEGPKRLVKETRLDNLRQAYEPYKQIYEQNSQHEELANYFYEKRLLGYCYSTSLQQIFIKACPELKTVADFESMEQRESGTFVGIVEKIIDATSKNKNRYTKLIINDGTGIFNCMIFDPVRTMLMKQKKIPKEGEVTGVKGSKFNTLLSVTALSPQNNKVFIKTRELKTND